MRLPEDRKGVGGTAFDRVERLREGCVPQQSALPLSDYSSGREVTTFPMAALAVRFTSGSVRWPWRTVERRLIRHSKPPAAVATPGANLAHIHKG